MARWGFGMRGRVAVAFSQGLIALLADASAARAADLPASLLCEFPSGTTSTYNAGAFSAKPSAAVNFNIRKIDLEGQAAEIVVTGDDSPGRLAIARAVGANHFLEVVTEGYWNITTVYDLDEETKRYPAVHSRHFGLVGQPVVAQYAGSCQASP
jgi:hypothetical protein